MHLENFDLENQLRLRVSGRRLIFRVNLPEVESRLAENIGLTDPIEVLHKLVPYISELESNILDNAKVYLLLDSADEVCPKQEENLLCAISAIHSLKDKYVVIASRPHPRSFIDKLSDLTQVESFTLCPLSDGEQVRLIQKTLPFEDHWEKVFSQFPRSVKKICDTPLALDLVCQAIKKDFSVLKKKINLQKLFKKLMELINERHLVEKQNMSYGANATEIRKLSMVQRDFNSYYQVSRQEFDEIGGEEDSLENSLDYREELLSFGLLVESNNNKVKFIYECFAEYFYASMIKDDKICVGLSFERL